MAVNPGVRTTASDNFNGSAKNSCEHILYDGLHAYRIVLALPSVVAASVIGDLKKVPHFLSCKFIDKFKLLSSFTSDLLKKYRSSLSDANAHCGDAVFHISSLHFMDEGRADAYAAAAQGMADGNGAAIDIYGVRVEVEIPYAGERLRRKGFIQLKQTYIRNLKACAFEQFLRRRHRSYAHVCRVHSCNRHARNPRYRLQRIAS